MRPPTTLLSCLFLFSVLAPSAEASNYPFSLEGIAVQSHLNTNIPGINDEGEGVGARFVYRFAGRMGIEIQASKISFDGALPALGLLPVSVPIDLDLEMADISLRFSLVRRDRFDFFVFGGAGYVGAEVGINLPSFEFLGFDLPPFNLRESGETYTWHAGIGAEIGIGDRLFLRGDARQRELPDDNEEGFVFSVEGQGPFQIDLDVEYSVSLGIRL